MPSHFPHAFALIATTMLVAAAFNEPSGAANVASQSTRADVENPIVIELFQSQGCSSCPPANAYLNAIADRPDILALSFAVTYWDQLGWKDTFASPRFTQRQQDYARAGRGQVATPELIVNGKQAVVGYDRQALDRSLQRSRTASVGPRIFRDGSIVRLSALKSTGSATVWLVRYDPRSRDVPIRAGENGGRTLPHRNIVRELSSLGSWSGPAVSFELPSARERNLATAILVQRGSGGPIIAARKL